jgi:hypothetical protein
MRKAKLFSILVVVMFLMVACAGTFTQNAYRSIYISGKSYDTSMKVVADLQKQGIIDQAKRDQINKIATIFYTAYQSASDALGVYVSTETATNQEKVVAALNALSAAWPEFAKLVNSNKANTMAPTLNQALKEVK